MSDSGSDVNVTGAVSLGWQVAQLFHGPLNRDRSARADDRLRGLAALPGQTQLLYDQIAALSKALLGDSAPKPVSDSFALVQGDISNATKDEVQFKNDVAVLHEALLGALQVADFRLGKGYGLGRALAETALVPAAAHGDEDTAAAFIDMFDEGRVGTLSKWLIDLKSVLPAHVAYGTVQSLAAWRAWVHRLGSNDPDWGEARRQVAKQGRLWRALVTGEKAAVDLLDAAGYLEAAHQIARNVGRSLSRFKWWLLGAFGVTVAVILGVSLLNEVPASVRLVTDLAWLAGVLGISLKGAGSLLGSALKDGEGWLWQSELDEAVAAAATQLPTGTCRERPASGDIGAMTAKARLAPSVRRDKGAASR